MEEVVSKEKKMKIISAIKSQPLLWKTDDAYYKNKVLKEAAWNEVGKNVGLSGERVKRTWNNLKDSRSKKIKQDTEDPNSHKMDSWEFAEALKFLSSSKRQVKQPVASTSSEEEATGSKLISRRKRSLLKEQECENKKKLASKADEVADKYWLLSLLPKLTRMPQEKKDEKKAKIQELLL